MEHPIIFIGYSLNDENIKSILYSIKQIIDENSEPMIPNMWFIDWSNIPIDGGSKPPSEKSISVGNGESVRLNYIKVHTYNKLYEALHQDSVDIGFLKQVEETVYNVVKSDTITNLEVDIASLRNLTDRDVLLNSFTTSPTNGVKETKSMLTFATINDPNQLAIKFTLTATQLCKRVYDNERSYWSYAYELIEEVRLKTGVSLRDSNNNYHVNMNGISRYSMDMVELLRKVKNLEPFTLVFNNEEVTYPS